MRRDLLACALIALFLASAAFAHPGHDHPSHHPVDYSPRDGDVAYAPQADRQGYYWWKGNLHTHTLWSDGDGFPEVVADWYKRHGYHFLALSDHNLLSRGPGEGDFLRDAVVDSDGRWIDPTVNRHARGAGGLDVYHQYLDRFGEHWVQTRRDEEGNLLVRLKPLQEIRPLFDEPGRFLLIEALEITDHRAVHVNATNVLHYIAPQRGDTVRQVIENNIGAVLEQRDRTGQPMFPHLNHPNWNTAVTVEDMVEIEDLRFFEIYNGHRGVRNFGDDELRIKPLDRMWDIMLTRRLAELNLGVLYGLAVDDAHHYEGSPIQTARPGRGWIMVRSRFLTPEHLVAAIERGDFYATTGVTLRRIHRDETRYTVAVEPEDGVSYTIEFIGTRQGYNRESQPQHDAEGNIVRATHRYSEDIGVVLHRSEGPRASYTFQGHEIYIRARVISSKDKADPFAEGEKEMAWTQPVVP